MTALHRAQIMRSLPHFSAAATTSNSLTQVSVDTDKMPSAVGCHRTFSMRRSCDGNATAASDTLSMLLSSGNTHTLSCGRKRKKNITAEREVTDVKIPSSCNAEQVLLLFYKLSAARVCDLMVHDAMKKLLSTSYINMLRNTHTHTHAHTHTHTHTHTYTNTHTPTTHTHTHTYTHTHTHTQNDLSLT